MFAMTGTAAGPWCAEISVPSVSSVLTGRWAGGAHT